jgi:hypothetical protein
MMRTKLTLFVAVLTVALFGMGCASTSKPSADWLQPYQPVKWNGHWYAVLPRVANYEGGKAACEQLGGHLAEAETTAEKEFLENLSKNVRLKLIRLRYVETVWVSGSEWDNTNSSRATARPIICEWE